MTDNYAQPARSDGAPDGVVPAVKTFATAVLLTFGAGLLLMVGYALLENSFGGFLGAVGAVFGVVYWKKRHDKVFPADIPTRSVLVLAAVNALLTVILFLTAG